MYLSVIMPIYNETTHEIKESVTSILNQTFSNFEFIIVDDNPSSKRIRKILLNFSKIDRRIKLIFNNYNMGPSASTNKGIKHSHGKFIARMDADDISTPNRFQKQLKFIKRYNLDFNCFNFSLMSLDGHLLQKSCYSRISQVNQHKIRRVMSYCSITNGPSFMFKRQVFDTIGGYRARWIEDYDFASRALVFGFNVGYLSDSLLYKRERKNSISNSNALKQYVGLNFISKYLRKYNFNKIVPTNIIDKVFNSISSIDLKKFYIAHKLINKFKNKKSLILFIRIIMIIFSSKLLLKFYLFRKILDDHQELLMR